MEPNKVDFPWPPKCSHYHGRARCDNLATVWIVAPDGKDVPGAWECEGCASPMIAEYREKLGEKWTMRPLITLQEETSC